jgi:hypothetical protein
LRMKVFPRTDGDGPHPHQDAGEIEGGQIRRPLKRVPVGAAQSFRGRVLQTLAHQQRRDAAGAACPTSRCRAAGRRGLRTGSCAVLGGSVCRGGSSNASSGKIFRAEEHLRAFVRRCVAPGRGRRLSPRPRRDHFRSATHRHRGVACSTEGLNLATNAKTVRIHPFPPM